MTTKLTNAFKRELDINGDKYTLTVSPEGFKLVLKGKRKGVEINWNHLVNGEAALAAALNASLSSQPGLEMPNGRHHTRH